MKTFMILNHYAREIKKKSFSDFVYLNNLVQILFVRIEKCIFAARKCLVQCQQQILIPQMISSVLLLDEFREAESLRTDMNVIKMMQEQDQITRREAIRKMGVAAATVSIGMAGTEALAADKNERQLKVMLLNGSPRRDGNTFLLLSEVAAQLEKNGIGSELFQLGTGNVRGCSDCGGCRGGRRCIFNDVVGEIADKMASCDGLIVGAPVYYGAPAGQVLSALQRLAYSSGGVLQGKPAAVLTVCRRGGATAAMQTLQMPFQLLNMPLVTSQYWNIAYGAAKGEVLKDEEGLRTMRTLADNMAYILRQFATGTAQPPRR